MFQVSYIYDLVDKMSPQLKAINNQVAQVTGQMEKMASKSISSMQRSADSIKNLGRNIRNAGLDMTPMSVGMGFAGVSALKASANFETLGIQLEVLTGSVEKGKALFQDLTQYANATPFQLQEITQATRTLLGSNIALKDVVGTTKMLGDVAAGSGANIHSLAVVFGQVAGMTKLQGNDAVQFISNGIPIWALLQKSTGKSIDVLRKMGSDGKISFKMVEEAMTKATQEGGMYYESTKKLSESLAGIYSTTKDQITAGLGAFGDEIAKVLNLKDKMKSFNGIMGGMLDKFNNLSPTMKSFIVYAGLALTILPPLLLTVGFMAIGIGGLTTAFTGLGVAMKFVAANPIMLLVAAFATLYTTSEDFRTVVNFLGVEIVDAFKDSNSQASQFLSTIKEIINIISKPFEWSYKLGKMAGEGYVNAARYFMDKQEIPQLPSPLTKESIDLRKKLSVTNPNIPVTNPSLAFERKQNFSGFIDIGFKNAPSGTTAQFRPARDSLLQSGTNSLYR